MAKKSIQHKTKKEFDFFFLVVVSVFAALTVFAAGFLTRTKQEVAAQRQALDVAQLDLATPRPTPQTPVYKNITPTKK